MPTDTERMEWLENAKSLSLFSDGSTWTTESGEKFISKFALAANGTQYGPAKTLRDQIDKAMAQQNGNGGANAACAEAAERLDRLHAALTAIKNATSKGEMRRIAIQATSGKI